MTPWPATLACTAWASIGSVATGASVAARASGKTQLLELGGNGPMVILQDADLGLAAEAALEAAYLCAGQSCTAGERFLVHAAVRAEFTERVVALTKDRIRLGDPFDPGTTMGPLNNEPTAAKFDAHVGGAVARGARVCCGGARAAGFPTALYAEPTVLDGVTVDMEIAREETFGPVVPVVEVDSAGRALELTNGSPYGLTAAVFTGDLERGLAFAEQARARSLGQHQRLDQPVGVPPAVRRPVRLGERARPGRRPVRHGDLLPNRRRSCTRLPGITDRLW